MDRRGVILGLTGAAVAGAAQARPVQKAQLLALAAQMEENLRAHVLEPWFPRAVDTARGGFHQNYADDWSEVARYDRASVYQARLTWMSAQAARLYPGERARWSAYSQHGLRHLADRMWDAEHGGFFWGRAGQAPFTPERDGEKHVYGHSFGIYAAAANHQATGSQEALALGQRAFRWLHEKAHDGANGGYFESLTREGRPLLAPIPGGPAVDGLGTPVGQKSMNTHIHVLEALSALYEVWPDPHLRARLEEVFLIVRDKVATAPGRLHLFFRPDWTPVPRAISFGHDVETGFLLVEAATALGRGQDERTWQVARMLVDQPLAAGWDKAHGGFFDEADLSGRIIKPEKIWWVQAEGLNALLLMHRRYGAQTPKYWDAFQRQWEFIRSRQIDVRHRGWRSRVEADGAPVPGLAKSNRWTECYHQGRALIRCIEGLREMAGEGGAAKHG